jgi:hypothetical protein
MWRLFINQQTVYWCLSLRSYMCWVTPVFGSKGKAYSRGQVLLFLVWWSYNSLVSLLCLWTYSLQVCFNFNIGYNLKKHDRPCSIRVDPCSKSFYISIYSIILSYNIITIMTIPILNFFLILCILSPHCGHAGMFLNWSEANLRSQFNLPLIIYVYIFYVVYTLSHTSSI